MCENCVANLGCAQPVTSSFNLRVTLSDHTGSISSVRLTGNTACQVLGISVSKNNNKYTSYSINIIKKVHCPMYLGYNRMYDNVYIHIPLDY
jgi:hypothetical protein